MSSIPHIYLDYAATTPVAPSVTDAMSPYLTTDFGNPSSIHFYGRQALIAIDSVRSQIADFLGCKTHEIIFTSGATEANNIAIIGTVEHAIHAGYKKPHIITSAIEHEAVLEPCRHLERIGRATITYIKPDEYGVVAVHDIETAISDETVLVSLMYANNETGSIQPVRDVGKLLKRINKQRTIPLKLHTDAVQATGYLNCHIDHLKTDMLSLSGHKIFAPKGIGLLYIREGTEINPIFFGGHQQKGIRPGTLATPLIVGLGEAIKLLKEKSPEERCSVVKQSRDTFFDLLRQSLPDIELNSHIEKTLPGHLNLYIPGIDNVTLMTALDIAGVSVSAGAACATGSLKPSHVLSAQGLDSDRIQKSLRISLSQLTSNQEIKEAAARIVQQISALRAT